MAENKEFKFDTVYQSNGDGKDDIVVTIQPESFTPNTVKSVMNIGQNIIEVNNKTIQAGNLGMVMKNHLHDIDFYVGRNGHLYVSAEDSKNYSIDSTNGHLIYNYR